VIWSLQGHLEIPVEVQFSPLPWLIMDIYLYFLKGVKAFYKRDELILTAAIAFGSH